MKHGTLKTLGAAALGAAFAVSAAGTASATPILDSGATGVLKKLPVKQAAQTVTNTAKTAKKADPIGDLKTQTNSKGNLLGGLPISKGLPIGG